MRQTISTRAVLREEDFSKSLKWSLLFHVIVGLLLVFHAILAPKQTPFQYVPTLRVDLVDLPRVLKKDLIHVPKRVEPKTIPPSKEAEKESTPAALNEMVIQSSKKKAEEKSRILEAKNRKATEWIKKLQQIHDAVDQEENERLKSHLKGTAVAGNKLSPGTSLGGDAKEGNKENYTDLVREILHENFKLSPWLQRQSHLSAKVLIYIDGRGNLRRYTFSETSGNSQFDEAVKRAITESQPYPFPPRDELARIASDGIPFAFPL